MKYKGSHQDIGNSNHKIGVLVTNLGSPDAPKCPKLRRYLTQFLTDPRVIELPNLLRQFLVKGIIINVRSHKSAAAYRTVWKEEGSPLLINSKNFCNKLQGSLGTDFHVEMAMRYGNPSIESAIEKMHAQGIRKLITLPMYPQYSGSTTGSTMDALGDALKVQRWVPQMHFISDYYANSHYIAALANSIEAHWKANGKAEKLIFSFHGIPKRYVNNGDPYQEHCERTVKAVVEKLELKSDNYLLVYQSRVGKEPWLEPYCDKTMQQLPMQGINSVDVICPGFSADCLETIEEIAEENKEYFLEAGGKEYNYIPCLNSDDAHIDMANNIVTSVAKGFS